MFLTLEITGISRLKITLWLLSDATRPDVKKVLSVRVLSCYISRMNLKEAADYLNLSTKTLERAVKSGKLAGTKHTGEKGGLVYEFDREELDRFQSARSAPVHNPTIEPTEQTALTRPDRIQTDIIRPDKTDALDTTGQAAFVSALSDALALALDRRSAPVLSLRDAAQAFGISQSAIKAAIESGELKTHKIGARGASVIKRADLEKWLADL
jgi:excisionase family DNA binding protein